MVSAPSSNRAARYGLELCQQLGPRSGERLIDVGSGDGAVTLALLERVAPEGRVLAVDPDVSSLRRLQERASTAGLGALLEVAQGTALELGGCARGWLLGGGCQTVFSSGALHFSRDLDELEGSLRSMAGVLLPGGRLAVQLGGAGNASRILEAADAQARRLGLPSAAAGHGWTLPTAAVLAELAGSAGLVDALVERRVEPLLLDRSRALGLARSLARRHLATLEPAGVDAYLAAVVAEVCPDGEPIEERLVRLLCIGRRAGR